MPRRMDPSEIAHLLSLAVPLRLATVDAEGYPHVTPLWFVLDGEAVVMTGFADRPHVLRARANPRVGLVIDVEEPLRPDGERPNRQVRMQADAAVLPDDAHWWTTRIRRRYIDAEIAPGAAEVVQRRARVAIRVEPRTMIAVASVLPPPASRIASIPRDHP